ncbi:4-diphosphocytidyl-2C-methyl-D-erythritol synthase [Sulfitobacter sp. SK012]|uniref:nucleotidyltransferase family protein n=1 Tax=Sulfitobacter sp. SK012 TaxID=1389005 RepID=UPI000E0BB1CB|nr:nucleotidyltransferase family protein [Sulfitobacter sp. SK012]AXI46858.1 4-diphosphocytidyl-2C-methyl-D-erythritol synthase [Sulfitobacter sp. SK012]
MSDPAIDLPIIVLAAGQSRRMGRDKLLLEINGVPLVRRQAKIARSVTQGPVIVAVPPFPHARYAALEGLDVTVLPVKDAAEGMGASLRAAFAALPPDAVAAMVLLSDLPDLQEEDLRSVAQAVDLNSDILIWRGATQDGKPGHPAVFAASLFPKFQGILGDNGGEKVAAEAMPHIKLIPLPGNRARRDLDTPEDWAAWQSQSS